MKSGNLMDAAPAERWPALVGQVQGGYYILSGIWPLVSPGTFQQVTGPKVDFWLVETVGLLLVLAGAVLVLAARARRITREIVVLGLGLALLLAGIDVYCVFQPRTTGAYLLDAVVEVAIAVGWVVAIRQRRRRA
jgi:hypothetical protein